MTTPSTGSGEPMIESTFRNGSLTAISVLLGFSLGFLPRWASLPGPWQRIDLVALASLPTGIGIQVGAVAMLLSVASLRLSRYKRAITVFLAGLAFVAAGVGLAILGDVLGSLQQTAGG